MMVLLAADAHIESPQLPEARGLNPDPGIAMEVLRHWPGYAPTPLLDCTALAERCGVASLRIKDETARMGLGSFKGLGGTYAVARHLMQVASEVLHRPVGAEELATEALHGISRNVTFVCASAGNHGIAVAAGAAHYGARAEVYLSRSVPESFAHRLTALGAVVRRSGATYEESMTAAAEAAQTDGAVLLADSTWPGYWRLPRWVMTGYMVLLDEIRRQVPRPPTHIFLQAGVGGFAAAIAHAARRVWGPAPFIVVVEPSAARCLLDSMAAGYPVTAIGPESNMGRLDCKDPSLMALDILADAADAFLEVEDTVADQAVAALASSGIETSPSGAAGLAGLLKITRTPHLLQTLRLSAGSRVLATATETADQVTTGPGVGLNLQG